MNYNVLLASAQVMTADFYTRPHRALNSLNFRATFTAPSTGTPIMKWKVQICEDISLVEQDEANGLFGASATALWIPCSLPLGTVHGTGFTAPTNTVTEVDWDGAAALRMWINIYGIANYVRIFGDYQSGGNASSLVKIIGAGFEEE